VIRKVVVGGGGRVLGEKRESCPVELDQIALRKEKRVSEPRWARMSKARRGVF